MKKEKSDGGMVMEIYNSLKNIAEIGIKNQVIRDTDVLNEDGLLKCGVCGELRRDYCHFEGYLDILVPRQCKCDRFAEVEQKKKEQELKDRERFKELQHYSGLGSLTDARFEDWKVNNFNQKNYRLCKNYAERFNEMMAKNQGLFFWGDIGTGKSWAAACIANEVMKMLKSVCMVSSMSVVEDDSRCINSSLLILDDFGAERKTDFAAEKVFRLIDERYKSKKPFIITSNLTLDEMKRETDIRYMRMYDRILEVCYPMQFTGPSYRKVESGKRIKEMESLIGG